VIAWRRSTLGRLWLQLRVPVAVAALVTTLVLVTTQAADNLSAVVLFAVATFSITIALQELWRGTRARQAMTGDGPARAFVTLIARNRRRYGGYLVHIGIAVMFVGVAASTAFQHTQDVRLRPGQSATVGGYTFTYAKATARISQRAGELERIELGSKIRVTKDGKLVTTLAPNRGYYPVNAPFLGALTRYFEGDSTSEIGLKAGVGRDLWIAQRPDITAIMPIITKGDTLFAKAAKAGLPRATQGVLLGQALRGLVRRYAAQSPPAQFRILVSPMVFWLWIGALILVLGGLIAAWPTGGGGLRDRVRARTTARVARELGRAPATG
jgi:cytochrome c-type biogenesis protein CcmF